MRFIMILMISTLFASGILPSKHPSSDNLQTDSRELQLQDMIVLSLYSHMKKELEKAYADVLTTSPNLYPYDVDILDIERVDGFRGFTFQITLEAAPTVGPHIVVGKDVFTYQISPPFNVKLTLYQHRDGPNKNAIPWNYSNLLK
ncbi:DUF3888 domain-containing protein [Paenibacillus xylanilyticus]|uniref:DUF3888 domain-containing protein n=1 Tax=Paenibacillus xylanilyticus TaxID=248903 RepID=UPI0039A30599